MDTKDNFKKEWKNGLPGRRNRNVPRNKGGRVDRRGRRFTAGAGGGGGARTPVIDARVKIIARQRQKLSRPQNVRDARETLNSLFKMKDARMKLNAGRSLKLGSRLGVVDSGVLGDTVLRRTFNTLARRQRNESFDMMHYPTEWLAEERAARYRRTIDYDETLRGLNRWDPNNLPQLEVRLNALNMPSETRPNSGASYRHRELLRGGPRDDTWQLNNRRDEAIKSRLEPVRQEEGYRIVVSNLQPTVTHEDIKELFEDIGPLIGSRVVRPGTAEVVYRDLKDAVGAVDTYHNRQLDGQPMKCLLVKPSTSGSKNMVGTKGSIVPDLSTIHKALFMK